MPDDRSAALFGVIPHFGSSMGPVALAVALVLTAAACSSATPDAAAGDDDRAALASETSPAAADADSAPPVSLEDVDRVLAGDVSLPEGFEVPAGETWALDPAASTTVEVNGNVVVKGTLVLRPADTSVVHTLRFLDVDEAAFTANGMDPVASDVGLWVVGDGVLDVAGAEKTAWAYEWQPGWEGDEVVAAPNEPEVYDVFAPVAGPQDVPAVNDLGQATELLNLTRNVVIEGTPEGKAHVFVHSTQPQTIRYAVIRNMAPDLTNPNLRANDQHETGRYALHFHHNDDASRGSLVEGVVIRDTDNHAFVPHASHGITFRDTISFNTRHGAYWWDPTSQKKPGNASNDIRYERAVAALVRAEGGRTSAFQLAEGDGSVVVDSVAVGVQGAGSGNAGYGWPGTLRGVWGFYGNVAHNNHANGIFVWQNSSQTHVIEDFTAYYNSKPGVSHGGYVNAFVYRNLTLLDNDLRRGTGVAVESIAVGRPANDGGTDLQLWEGVTTGGAALRTSGNAADPAAPVRFVDCDFSEVILSDGRGHPSNFEFVDCDLQPEDITVEFMHPDSLLRSQNGKQAWELTPDGTIGDIAPFANDIPGGLPDSEDPYPENNDG